MRLVAPRGRSLPRATSALLAAVALSTVWLSSCGDDTGAVPSGEERSVIGHGGDGAMDWDLDALRVSGKGSEDDMAVVDGLLVVTSSLRAYLDAPGLPVEADAAEIAVRTTDTDPALWPAIACFEGSDRLGGYRVEADGGELHILRSEEDGTQRTLASGPHDEVAFDVTVRCGSDAGTVHVDVAGASGVVLLSASDRAPQRRTGRVSVHVRQGTTHISSLQLTARAA